MERRIWRAAAVVAGVAVMVNSALGAGKPERQVFLLSEQGSGRSTGYAEANKIVTVDGKTHVAWLDSADGAFRVRIRTLDRASGEWSPTYTVGQAHDNHGGPALAVDSKGYLHIVYYPHHHPFRYRRSVRPNDASEWGEEEQFGTFCTYPTLLVAPDDTLVLTCRESNKEKKPWVMNRYLKRPGQDWSGPHAVMVSDEAGYSHYQDALAWGPDRRTIHLSTRMYGGTPGRAHTVGYLRSHDLGETWEDATGKAVELPATSRSCTVLASARDVPNALRCGSVAIGADGAPMVLYSDAHPVPNRAWIVRLDPKTGEEQRQELQSFAARLVPGASVAMPGGLTVDATGRLHVVITMAPAKRAVRWGGAVEEVLYLIAPGFGADFVAEAVSVADPKVAHWLPNIERPTGFNQIPERPGVLFQGGGPGPKNTAVVANRVYFWW